MIRSDDLGYSEGVNLGIAKAVKNGVDFIVKGVIGLDRYHFTRRKERNPHDKSNCK